MIHLDTSFLLRSLVRGTSEEKKLLSWLTEEETMGISAIAWTEFLCGPLQKGQVEWASNMLPKQEPYLPDDGLLAARLFNETGRRRGSLADCMITATALRTRASIATANESDFRLFQKFGLKLC